MIYFLFLFFRLFCLFCFFYFSWASKFLQLTRRPIWRQVAFFPRHSNVRRSVTPSICKFLIPLIVSVLQNSVGGGWVLKSIITPALVTFGPIISLLLPIRSLPLLWVVILGVISSFALLCYILKSLLSNGCSKKRNCSYIQNSSKHDFFYSFFHIKVALTKKASILSKASFKISAENVF